MSYHGRMGKLIALLATVSLTNHRFDCVSRSGLAIFNEPRPRRGFAYKEDRSIHRK